MRADTEEDYDQI